MRLFDRSSRSKVLRRLGMIVALAMLAVCVANAQAPKGKKRQGAQNAGGAMPRIVSTTPAVGATDVDPAISEITVTFNCDMNTGGMSWTGGGPEFPAAPEGQRAHWKDNRTCVLPVKLEAAHLYRVGINAPSFRNFQSAAGAPVNPTAIYFTTKGASAELKAKVRKPVVVKMEPANGAKDVDPSITELRVTFDMPMGSGCSWCGGGPNFPENPEGKRAGWSDDHKTAILPVRLKPGWNYQLWLNSPSYNSFASEAGVSLDSMEYSFSTRK
jgi:hypothetical protein